MEAFKDAVLGQGGFRTYYPYYFLFTAAMIVGRYIVSQGVKWYVKKTNPSCKAHHPAKAAGILLSAHVNFILLTLTLLIVFINSLFR